MFLNATLSLLSTWLLPSSSYVNYFYTHIHVNMKCNPAISTAPDLEQHSSLSPASREHCLL